jgi:DNA-directed RNA polymerase specialized sigma24 family protein
VDAGALTPASTDPGPLVALERRDLRALLREAFEMLPATLRTAVLLRDIQEHSYQEIAAELDLPEGTVKSRINRGRIELARQVRRLQARDSAASSASGAIEARDGRHAAREHPHESDD